MAVDAVSRTRPRRDEDLLELAGCGQNPPATRALAADDGPGGYEDEAGHDGDCVRITRV